MLDSPLMLWVKLSVSDRIQPKLTGSDMGVENKAGKVIHNSMTALQRQLQRYYPYMCTCENENVSLYSSQSVTVSKSRSSQEDYRMDHLTF